MAIIILISLINRFRGGLTPTFWNYISKFIPRNFDYLVAITLTIVYCLHLDLLVSFLIALGFYIGASDGWGKQLGSILDRSPRYNESEGIFNILHNISNFFIKEKEDYLNYARLWMVLRGFQWMIFPLSVLVYYNIISILICVTVALLMGAIWVLCIELARFDNIKPINPWGMQEWIWGLCQGIMLYILV